MPLGFDALQQNSGCKFCKMGLPEILGKAILQNIGQNHSTIYS
jgi:hypothetical protein